MEVLSASMKWDNYRLHFISVSLHGLYSSLTCARIGGIECISTIINLSLKYLTHLTTMLYLVLFTHSYFQLFLPYISIFISKFSPHKICISSHILTHRVMQSIGRNTKHSTACGWKICTVLNIFKFTITISRYHFIGPVYMFLTL